MKNYANEFFSKLQSPFLQNFLETFKKRSRGLPMTVLRGMSSRRTEIPIIRAHFLASHEIGENRKQLV